MDTYNEEHVDIGLYIGRFSPFHKAHEAIVRGALTKCKTLIICFGSHSITRTQRDPWITIERIAIARSCFTKEELQKIKFYPLLNYGDMPRWITDIMLFIDNFKSETDTLGIFGCEKDESSWYLNEFPPCFKKIFVRAPFYDGLSATDIRKQYFGEGLVDETSLPPSVCNYLKTHVPDFIYIDLPAK
jgi:bifunctional NMN adenylyltransferase/nudix hydrolase